MKYLQKILFSKKNLLFSGCLIILIDKFKQQIEIIEWRNF